MTNFAQDAELGKTVLQSYIQLKEQLEERKMHLEELKNESGATLATKSKKEKVRESLSHDQMERKVINMMILEEDIETMEEKINQYSNAIREALRRIPELSAKLLRYYYIEGMSWGKCAEAIGYGEHTGNFRVLKNHAFEEFWNVYQMNQGYDNAINRAKECRMWKEYFERQKVEGKITTRQANKLVEEKMKLSLRQVQRLLKLLSLIPEFQHRLIIGQISESAAYHIAFLSDPCQHQLADILSRTGISISVYQAQALKKLTTSDWIHMEKVLDILGV